MYVFINFFSYKHDYKKYHKFVLIVECYKQAYDRITKKRKKS